MDRLDFWSDGTADVVRENGVLRGYGMNFYDATKKEGWSPSWIHPGTLQLLPLARPPLHGTVLEGVIHNPKLKPVYNEIYVLLADICQDELKDFALQPVNTQHEFVM